MHYLDTSVLVSVLTANERASSRARAWLDRQPPDDLAISDWVVAEFSAALSIKLRTGALVETQRARALALFTDISAASLRMLAVNASHFRIAARFCDQAASGLRAGDALHLAIALDHGARLHSLDRRQVEAAASFGVQAQLI